MHDSAELLQRLLAAGVNGFLLKTIALDDLLAAVRSISSDAGRVIVEASPASLTQRPSNTDEVLSPRQREVLTLAAEACTNAQIACRLSLSEATVKRHMRNIFVKLGAVSRVDAVNKAVAASLIRRPGPAPPPGRDDPLR
jgi:DNA-binding NarL/FixJ family response regulator